MRYREMCARVEYAFYILATRTMLNALRLRLWRDLGRADGHIGTIVREAWGGVSVTSSSLSERRRCTGKLSLNSL